MLIIILDNERRKYNFFFFFRVIKICRNLFFQLSKNSVKNSNNVFNKNNKIIMNLNNNEFE